jgi:hypothetical protein
MTIASDFILWIGAINLVSLCAVVLAMTSGRFGD